MSDQDIPAMKQLQDLYTRDLAAKDARIAELEKALNRAGDRLAQVQPAVTESWAYDIVPKAEQEIADALAIGPAVTIVEISDSTAQLDAQDHAGRR